jgi:hypothetical protein
MSAKQNGNKTVSAIDVSSGNAVGRSARCSVAIPKAATSNQRSVLLRMIAVPPLPAQGKHIPSLPFPKCSLLYPRYGILERRPLRIAVLCHDLADPALDICHRALSGGGFPRAPFALGGHAKWSVPRYAPRGDRRTVTYHPAIQLTRREHEVSGDRRASRCDTVADLVRRIHPTRIFFSFKLTRSE